MLWTMKWVAEEKKLTGGLPFTVVQTLFIDKTTLYLKTLNEWWMMALCNWTADKIPQSAPIFSNTY